MKTCSEFLAEKIPSFVDATAECPVKPESLRFVTMANERAFEGVVVHHSGVMRADSPAGIANWLFKEHGWPMSYHFLIPMTGDRVYQCKIPEVRSAHCGSKYGNLRMLAICLEGNWVGQPPHKEQLKLLNDLLRWLEVWRGRSFGLVPHKAISSTVCPGMAVDSMKLFTRMRLGLVSAQTKAIIDIIRKKIETREVN